jgi:hypothetical protein
MVMALAIFMILTQLGIAPVIVTITYIALIGSTALAAALAFGLGGREAAAELVNSGYENAQDRAMTFRLGEVEHRRMIGYGTGPRSRPQFGAPDPVPPERSGAGGSAPKWPKDHPETSDSRPRQCIPATGCELTPPARTRASRRCM